MKATPTKIQYLKSKDSKYGMLHDFRVTIITDDGEISGFYSTNDKNFNPGSNTQNKFTEGVECDIEVHEMVSKDGKKWYKIKPEQKQAWTNNQALKKEQARYASFAYSYCKDLIIADKLPLEHWGEAAKKVAKGMIEIDKEL